MSPHFRSALLFTTPGGLPVTLAQPLVYVSAIVQDPITVPARFETDLASIPRVLWAVLPPTGKYDGAAVLHDWLYRAGGVTREQADAVLLEAMEVLQVGRVARWLIYRSVRVGGAALWDAARAADVHWAA
jgi:hypothetical protein